MLDIVALIMGLGGLATWLEPRIGFIVSYLSFFLGFLQAKKRPPKHAKLSMALGVVGFVLSLVHLILSVTVLK